MKQKVYGDACIGCGGEDCQCCETYYEGIGGVAPVDSNDYEPEDLHEGDDSVPYAVCGKPEDHICECDDECTNCGGCSKNEG